MVQTMARGDGGCCPPSKNSKSKTFEIKVPECCDSGEMIQSILGKISRRHVPPGDSCDEDSDEDVCSDSSSEDCMDLKTLKNRQREDPKSIKKKHKLQAKKRKTLKKECQKKAKEIIKDFKLKEKHRRKKEKDRLKKIKRYEKQKDKEEKKCRKERKKCEKDKEKVRRVKEKEKLRSLKERMKMKCESLKYARASDCDDSGSDKTCSAATRAATEKRKQKSCCG